MFINEEFPVKIHIQSSITDLVEEDFCEKGVYEASGQFYPHPLEQDEKCEKVDYYADGILHVQDTFLSVSYSEREDMGFENASTTVFFDSKTPQLLTMVRSGDGATVLRFDPAAGRQMVTYNTPYLPLEFAMTTREVVNHLTPEGGELHFDYLLEMHGVKTERTEFTLTVTRTEEEA